MLNNVWGKRFIAPHGSSRYLDRAHGQLTCEPGEPRALQALNPGAVWMPNSPGLHYDEAFSGPQSTLKFLEPNV